MQRLPLIFLATAAFCLLLGTGLGIGMGIAHDFRFSPVHAHLNLLGWTSLALMGLTYAVYPALGQNRLAAIAQFTLSGVSALLFPVGIAISIDTGNPGFAIATSLAWFAGVALFLARIVLLALRPDAAAPRRRASDRMLHVPAE
ncbi:cytochrome-c oxidase [Elioraea rosea]|uniref:cytochrome-c oxidase n=1 Tax=Elioraea rosea TaxID=2492390 RepID=UPI0011841288|nr:cytochrome-c oxidase [Elioraea rosea]